MNEQAIQDAYALFSQSGYKKSIGEFKTLLGSNPQALKDAYDLFASNGYQKSIDDFSSLMGVVKKKEPTQSVSRPIGSTSPSPLSLNEQLAQAPALPKDARVEVPIGSTQQPQQDRAITATPARTPLQVSPKEIKANQSKIEGKLNEFSIEEFNKSTESLKQKEVMLESLANKANAGDKNAEAEYRKLYGSYEKEIEALTPKINEYNSLLQQYQQLEEQGKSGIVVGDELQEEKRNTYRREGLNLFTDAIERGMLAGEQADLLNAFQNMEDADVARLSEIQEERERFVGSEDYQRLGEMGFVEFLKAAPLTAIGEVVTESLAAMIRHGYARAGAGAAMGATAGSVIPVVGTAAGAGSGFMAGMGAASLNLEYSSKFIETLAEAGIDVKDADALKAAFNDEEMTDKARNIALRKGIPIAVFDLISGGVAGKFAAKAGSKALPKVIAGVKEGATQAAFGGGGELAGQLVAGEEINPVSILLEMVAEPFTSIPEVAVGVIVRNAKGGKQTAPNVIAELVTAPDVDLESVSEMLDVSVGLGEITPEQKDAVLQDIERMSAAAEKVPQRYSEKAVELAPLIFEKSKLDEGIAALEVEKAKADDALVGGIDEQIAELNQQKEAINGQIQSIITPSEATTNQEAGTAVREDEAGVGIDGDGVQEVGNADVQQVASDFFGYRVQQISSDLDSRMQNADEIDINEIESVSEDLIGLSDSISKNKTIPESTKKSLLEAIEAKVNELLNYEFATTNETETVAERATTKSIIPTPREGVRQTVSKERFADAEVMSKGTKGKIQKNGNFFDLVFGNTKIPIDWNFIEFVESKLNENGDLSVTLLDSRSGTEFAITDNELALDVAISESQKQIGVVPDGTFDQVVSEVVNEKKVTNKKLINEKAKEPLLGKLQNDREQNERREESAPMRPEKRKRNWSERGEIVSESWSDKDLASEIVSYRYSDSPSKIESDRYSKISDEFKNRGYSLNDADAVSSGNKVEKVGGKDADAKPSAEKVSVGKQSEGSKEVREQDTKGQEAAKKSTEKAKSKLEQAREKRKAAIEKLKQNIDKAKNVGIASLDFNQRMKDDKEFFGAIKDIIESNVEIGITKISEIYAEIADIVGKSLSVTDKAEVKKIFNQVVLKELRSEQLERFEAESVRDAMKEYLNENKKALNSAANAQALKMVNAAQTESSFIAAIKYLDKIIGDKETRDAYNAASEAIDKAKKKADTLAGTQEVKGYLQKINAFGIKASELLKEIADVLDPSKPMPKAATIKALADKVIKYVEENMKGKQPTIPDVRKRLDNLFLERKKDENGNVMRDDDGNPIMVAATFDTAAKVRGLMRRVSNIKNDIAKLDITIEEQEAFTEEIDKALAKIDEIAKEVGEAIQEQKKENIKKAKEIISSLSADDFADPDIYEANILPIMNKKGSIDLLDELTYTQSEMLLDALADVENGYLPVGFYRNFTEPLVGNDRVKAALELAKSPTEGFLASILKFRSKGMNQARKLLYGFQGKGKYLRPNNISKFDLRKMLDVTFADKVDNLFGKGRTEPFNNNFVIPLKRSFDNISRSVTDMFYLFSKESGMSVSDLLLMRGANETSLNKVGAFLLQRRIDNERGSKGWNALKYNSEYADKQTDKAVQSAISASQKSIWVELNDKYPDGIKESDLTAKEKKLVAAFDRVIGMLTKMQKISNLRGGKVFNAIEGYAPLLAMENVMEASRTLAEANDFTNAMEMLSLRSNSDKNSKPKYRSDRGLNSDPNSGPYIANTNASTLIANAISQVVTEYYMLPIMYSANRAFTLANQESKENVGDYLRDRFADIIRNERLRLRTTAAKRIGNLLSGIQSTILLNVQRFTPEFIGGMVLHARYAKIRNSPAKASAAFAEAVKSSFDGSFRKAANLAFDDGFNRFEEIEIGKSEEFKRRAGKFAKTLTSPDSLQETAFSRAAFVFFMKDKYKEITGKTLSMSDLNDAEFFRKNKDALKESSDFAYKEVVVKADTRFGRPVRPVWYLPLIDSTKGDWSLMGYTMSYFLSGFAMKQGSNLSGDMYDALYGVNKDKGEAAITALTTIASASAYQVAKGAQMAALGGISILAAEYLAGDDEEEKERIVREAKASVVRFTNEMLSARFMTAQFISGFMYLITANQGSIGKLMIYLTGDIFIDRAKEYYKQTGQSELEFIKEVKEPIENLVKDATYKEIANTRKDGLLNTYSILAGGGAVGTEEIAKLWNASQGAFEGDGGDAVYALGTIWNIAYGRKVPLPFTRYIAKGLREKDVSLENAIRRAKADKRKEGELIEQLVLKHGSSSLEGKVNADQALSNLFEESFKLMPDRDAAELEKEILDKYDDLTLPAFIKGIKSKQTNKEKGLEAAKWSIKIEDMGDSKEAVEMRISLWDYLSGIKESDDDFWDFYYKKIEEENKK